MMTVVEEPLIQSERVDDLPPILYWLCKMGVAQSINEVVGPDHGNREALSYGLLAFGFLAYLDPLQGMSERNANNI
jgi:hypothetical protein